MIHIQRNLFTCLTGKVNALNEYVCLHNTQGLCKQIKHLHVFRSCKQVELTQ